MSRLPLTERLKRPMKQPKEIAAYSVVAGKTYLDDRALRYYYFPAQEVEKNLNLTTGFSQYHSKPTEAIRLDSVLAALVDYEKINGRLDVNVITWRGVLTRIMSLSRDMTVSWRLGSLRTYRT